MKNHSKEYFKLEYSGGETSKNELTVRELAPSLLAFSDFVEEVNSLLNGSKVNVDLKFRASREGSIIVELGLDVNLLEQIVDFFKGDAVTALLNLKEVLGLAVGGSGMFKLFKWLQNRQIEKVQVNEGKKVVLVLEDGERLEITENELRVLKSVKARKRLVEFAEPVKNKTADKITLYEDEKTKDEKNGISKDEVKFFEVPELPEELVNETKQEVAITIENLSFKEGNKWRVSDGNNEYYVSITDQEFINDIKNNSESFRYDDILKVEMLTRQFKTGTGLKTEHEILDVKDHIPPVDQISFDFE